MTLYTFVRDSGPAGGTYFRVEEGRLYNGNQYIRTTSMKDSVDIIERIFKLSNDTKRFCVNGIPPPFIERIGGVRTRSGMGGGQIIPNPVEVCATAAGDCFNQANISRTCMDVPGLAIYIRSRIEDIRGRKWITDESGDPYVNIQ